MVFRTTFTHTYTTALPSSTPAALVLSLLHDFPAMITLNPLVQSYQPITTVQPPPTLDSSPSEYSTFAVTDLISYLPLHLWDATVTYTCALKRTPDGLDTVVNAQAGVVSHATWRVVQGEQGLVLEERAEVECAWLIAGVVRKQMKMSHGVLAERFLERLRERGEGGWEEKGTGG